jgi:hypothetical protein
MACHPSQGGLEPSSAFLCHPTGGGKSLVRDTFAVAQNGVTWCILPLVSLAADQEKFFMIVSRRSVFHHQTRQSSSLLHNIYTNSFVTFYHGSIG